VPAVRLKLRSVYVRIAVFRHHPWIVLANVLITTGIFLLSASQFLLAFKALDVHAPDFSRLLVSYGPISIMGYLPFTVSGAGVSEALAIAIWTGPKVGSEEIIAAFVIARLFTLISTFLLPSVIYAGRFGRARLAKLSNSHANRF